MAKKAILITVISIAIIASLGVQCKKLRKDDELSLTRINYNGKQLRIDGYYYLIDNNTLFGTYFFYSTGISISGGGGGSNTTPLDFIETQFQSNSYLTALKERKSAWGLFLIKNNTIKIEHWYCAETCKAYVREGQVINDTTFVITESYRMKDGTKTEVKTKNETYHFKQFSPKPDSTNEYVK